eukprot:PLAT5902.1.p2 GENE.PLAT5902.1~~PLAT5902.1.p2  ORF type:complete len:158 (-),score=33.37 PLAT5902.1:175-609(-)
MPRFFLCCLLALLAVAVTALHPDHAGHDMLPDEVARAIEADRHAPREQDDQGPEGDVKEPEPVELPPTSFYRCLEEYGDTALSHSLCAWHEQGILCEQIKQPVQCSRWSDKDEFWMSGRLSEFTDKCAEHCMKPPAHAAHDDEL